MKSARRWAAIAVGSALCWGWTAAAQVPLPPVNGPTQVGEICMQKVFGTPVTNSNRLNCTASDIKIARAIDVSPKSCVKGSRIPVLRGRFQVDVTANIRYDAGFFFRLDGGADARGDGAMATGQCSLSALDPSLNLSPLQNPSLNLDGDSCGDLRAGSYMVDFEIPEVLCDDTDGNGKLNLPNCTSWHSNAGTACTIINENDDEATTLRKAKTFNPETKSKCNCDDRFEVEVKVEDPKIVVNKTATPDHVRETGEAVTFDVEIVNEAATLTATITSLTDTLPNGSVVNLLTIAACGTGEPNATRPGPCSPTPETSCPSLGGTVIPALGSATCAFKAFVSGNTGALLMDTVKACTSTGNGPACDEDDATVGVTDVQTDPEVTKTATAVGCSIDASYRVVVTNPSKVDVLTVNALTDDKFGSITGTHPASIGIEEVVTTDCAAGSTINPLGNYSCTFTGRVVSPSCDINHVNTVTAATTDDDGQSASDTDTARVTVVTTTDTPSD